MSDRIFWKNDSVVAFNALQIAEGMAQGLQELTEVEKQALLSENSSTSEKDFKHFTGQDKLSIFTQDEQKAIYRAAYRDYDEDVMLVVKGLDNALYLTYSDERTVAGLELLEAKGLITPERHQEIIAVMTADKEP